jgi:hypothetical protein
MGKTEPESEDQVFQSDLLIAVPTSAASAHLVGLACLSISTGNSLGNRRRSGFVARPWPALGSDFGRMG